MRTYSTTFTATAATAAVDFFEFAAAANKPIELVGMTIAQTSEIASNVGEDEFLTINIVRGNTTTGSGGSTFTPLPFDPFDPAAGFTAKVMNTTAASAGTPGNLHVDTFNIRLGFGMVWPQDFGPRTHAAAGFLVARLAAAPADSITWTGTAYIREY